MNVTISFCRPYYIHKKYTSMDVQEYDYGPLKLLIGKWEGDKGMDIAPDPSGTEENPYSETIVFEGIGDVNNAKKQNLTIVRYHQVVKRKSNDQVFHDQIGYWLWDKEGQTIMHSYTIPRGVCVIAGGFFEGDVDAEEITLEVEAKQGDDWGIIEQPFMQMNASTKEFKQKMVVTKDKLIFSESTLLSIYGTAFDHTDDNTLTRIG